MQPGRQLEAHPQERAFYTRLIQAQQPVKCEGSLLGFPCSPAAQV